MSHAQTLFGKTLSNGETIEKVALFHDLAAYLINEKYVVSLGATMQPTIDTDKAKPLADFPNQTYSEISVEG